METEQMATAEIRDMEKIAYAMKLSNQSNGVFDKIEIERQMMDLTRALFGTQNGLWIARGESPALSWLNSTEKYMNTSLQMFDNEMKNLVTRSFQITPTYRNGAVPFVVGFTGQPIVDADGVPTLNFGSEGAMYIPKKALDDFNQDRQAALTLSNLTAQAYASTDDRVQRAKELTCNSLENTWFYWSSAVDHLAAESFFCGTIERYFDSSTESNLVQLCQGKADLLGNVQVPSGLMRTQSRIAQKKYATKSTIVSARISDLSCVTPDAAATTPTVPTHP